MVTDAVLPVPIKTDVVPRPTTGAFVSAAPTVTEFPMATPERLVTKISVDPIPTELAPTSIKVDFGVYISSSKGLKK